MFTDEQKSRILDVKCKIELKFMAISPYTYKYLHDPPMMFLSGGAICSLLNGEEPKDWDMYFVNEQKQKQFIDSIFLNYKHEIADVKENYKDAIGTDGKMITANAITMKDGVSFITSWCGTPEEVRKHFDYVHCMPYYYKSKLHISPKQYHAIVNKKLIVNNPDAITQWRREKFIQRGFTN